MFSYTEAVKQKEKLDEIIRKECNDRQEKIKSIQNAAVQGLIGRYYSKPETGADDDPFQVCRVIRRGWNDSRVFVHSVGYWHDGHYGIRYKEWGYSVFEKIQRGWIKEITQEEYQKRVVDFLKRVGDLDYLTFAGGSSQ